MSANNDFDMSYNNKGNAGGLENSLTMLQSAAKLQESIAKVPALKTIASLVMERCTNNDDSTVTTCHMFDFLSMCADHLTDSFLHKSSKKHMMKNHKMTMFVPTDDAFGEDELAFMKDTRNKKVTCSIMQYHITAPGYHNDLRSEDKKETDVNLFSSLNGWPIVVSNLRDNLFLNLNSVVSGSKSNPPRVLDSKTKTTKLTNNKKTSKKFDTETQVVVHFIDRVATPVITREVMSMALPSKDTTGDNKNLKSTGRSFFADNPGKQTGKIIPGPQFYQRNAFGQVYFPFTGIFTNLLTGYSSSNALYCQSVRCKGPSRGSFRFGGSDDSGSGDASIDDELVETIEDADTPATPTIDTIVDAAIANPDLSDLAEAVTVAGLIDALSDASEIITVFTPTNAAFQALYEALGVSGPSEVDLATLTQVLSYHLVPGVKALSTDLSNGQELPTGLAGADLTVDINDSGIFIDGVGSTAQVITPDILIGDNAVAHVIDTVLLPIAFDLDAELEEEPTPEPGPDDEGALSVAAVAVGEPDLSLLVAALTAADAVDGALSDPESVLTVLAPVNSAFTSLLDTLQLDDLSQIPLDLLNLVLGYHIIPGAALAASQLTDGESLTAMNGVPLEVKLTDDGGVKFVGLGSEADVLIPNIKAGKAIIHVISDVLLPIGGAASGPGPDGE